LLSLLAYYGEASELTEGAKPDDFFALVMSFSSALNKAAIEVLDAQPKIQVDVAPSTPVEEEAPENAISITATSNTSLFPPSAHGMSLLPPPTANSQNHATGRQSIGRGDLDQAIRSIRDGGQRRARPVRPLSKIFLDGGRPASRVFDT